jgi:hypothetical protein
MLALLPDLRVQAASQAADVHPFSVRQEILSFVVGPE